MCDNEDNCSNNKNTNISNMTILNSDDGDSNSNKSSSSSVIEKKNNNENDKENEKEEGKCRTVNDFISLNDLQNALVSTEIRSSSDAEKVKAKVLESAFAKAVAIGRAKANDDNDRIEKGQDNSDWVLQNYDKKNTISQSISQESVRLRVLKSYMLLDSVRDEQFERLTAIGCETFRVPICLVSLVDLGRQFFMSNRGLGDTRETPRDLAFCAHAIMGNNNTADNTRGILTVPDAVKDYRFVNNALVTGPPHIRFYAGAPLVTPEGYKLGTFCVIDKKPHPTGLSNDEQEALIDLATQTVKIMVDRRKNVSMKGRFYVWSDKDAPVAPATEGQHSTKASTSCYQQYYK